MLTTLINAFKNKDIRVKVYKMLLLLLVFRIGCFIPVPGLIRSTFETAITGNDFLTLMSSITGGALAQGTLFALGIGPYINASIIMQLLCVGIPALERLSKLGEEGRKKISQYTRYATILLAVIQSVGIIVSFGQSQNAIQLSLFGNSAFLAGLFMTIVYTAGAFIVMWLGERITEHGVGNGQSMIIFTGILATAGNAIVAKFGQISTDTGAIWELIAFVLALISVDNRTDKWVVNSVPYLNDY
jgi:preprotein translocase subunit SecY